MSLKKKVYWLTTLLVSFTVIASFTWNIYFTWQLTLNDRYKETTAIAQLLDESFDAILAHTDDAILSEDEQILQLNTQLQPAVNNIITSFPDFGAGYYMKDLHAVVAFGPDFKADGLVDISPTSDARTVYETKEPLRFYNYSQTRDGYVVATIYPIIRNGEVIGHSWANVLVDDLVSFFKKDVYLMLITLFLMLLIAVFGSSLITKQYIKQLKEFRQQVKQSTPSKKLAHKFPQELQDIYQEIMTSKETLIESEKRFRDVVTAFDEFVWETDLAGNYTYLSNRVQSILGYDPQVLMGTNTFDGVVPPYNEAIMAAFKQSVKEQAPFRNLHYMKQTASGDSVHLCSNGLPIFNEQQQLIGYRGATRDVSIEKQHEQHIHSLAYYDQLTQLPNRTLLMLEINQHIQAKQPFAILFLDLDQFKQVNDSLSHTAGDELLKITAHRLTKILIENDRLFRFGGDEFIMTLTNFKSTCDLAPRIQQIVETLGQPLALEGIQLFNTGSIGISVYPEHGETAEVLIKNADMAMYQSKGNGRNQATFYTAAFESDVTESFALANDLKEALGTNQFVLNYQPQVGLYSGKIVGVEALIRWYHPTRGFIPPDKFIHIAEEHGHILDLGKWILHQACVDRKKWLDAGLGHFRMAVNISIKQFEQADFVELVLSKLAKTGLDAQYLELEITEGIAMAEPEIVIEKLKRLKEHNIYISIDDFGMGYSSLNYLKRLPINQLKIDRAFVKDIEQKNDYAIVQSIISMAHSLDLEVVAEGVETEQHAETLRSLHCGIAQGYHYYKPMTEKDLFDHLTGNASLLPS
ncbi:MAG: EAL domain-containing protein [Solibacillus sp.]